MIRRVILAVEGTTDARRVAVVWRCVGGALPLTGIVASEAFFLVPRELRAQMPALYALLCGYYRQDPAAG